MHLQFPNLSLQFKVLIAAVMALALTLASATTVVAATMANVR